ncbi:putative glycine dehydrogenase [decarboxylating] subunit 1 [Anaerohalosphaera lusitana]|uniref:Probable glycine dehydrogenase (decarboxylating) subunit 1 n=1 Tax=Anaerohalosphaera lusitana TaxID=1936003 RepID=A0A1U9NQQ8_9BACT|nr:aminomethyl-transferring glycine dehydrogenase subunit GcvPA [Anaerohalosphaera lusitana]AQT70155.1 putative glycine dehydrogenase [decarboxylating] subunit 1 [Anaerohalosphaera lusitana]
MPFISNTDQQQQQMLEAIGLTMDDLFADIPDELKIKNLELERGLTEQELQVRLQALSGKNSTHLTYFLGGGFYDHFIPAAIPALAGRSEFYTAYTPYQPEISQGTLQAIYEFQSMICRLTGMEVSNASMYDGGTAMYEAMMMALRKTRRNKVIIDDSVNPIYRVMIHSYTQNLNIELDETKHSDGRANRDAILEQLDKETGAVILQNPNFFGCIDDFTDIAEAAHEKGALLIMCCYPTSLGILKTPGSMGADIVVGEGQCLGLPLSFGGPYLGVLATTRKLMRKMPGRIAAETTDGEGNRGYVLTLQAREQHIRRDKATSNICSNEALCALQASIYMSLLGKKGLKDIANLCADKASYAFDRLTAVPGVKARWGKNWFYNEFVIDLPTDATDVVSKLIEKGIAAGFPLSRYYEGMDNALLIAVTEKRTKQEISTLADALEAIL